MPKAPTLYSAVSDFLAPLMAEYARVIDEGADDMPVTISLGGLQYKTTLADLKKLDRAHQAAFEAKEKRDAKKSRGSLL